MLHAKAFCWWAHIISITMTVTVQFFPHSITHSLTHSLTHSHSLTHTDTHTHSLTHSLTHSQHDNAVKPSLKPKNIIVSWRIQFYIFMSTTVLVNHGLYIHYASNQDDTDTRYTWMWCNIINWWWESDTRIYPKLEARNIN